MLSSCFLSWRLLQVRYHKKHSWKSVTIQCQFNNNKATWRWREPTCLFFSINSDLDLLTLTFDLDLLWPLTFSRTDRQTDRQTDGQTDGQKATPKSPPCMSTGGLKNYVSTHKLNWAQRIFFFLRIGVYNLSRLVSNLIWWTHHMICGVQYSYWD